MARLQQEREAQAAVVKAEQERLDALKASFGLLSPPEKKAALDIARKLAAGQELTSGAWTFAQAQPVFQESPVFQEALAKWAQSRP